MRGRAAITRLVLLYAALGLAAPAALGERRILLAGDTGAVWLASWDPDDGSWWLSVRPAGASDWEDPREVQARELRGLKGLGAAGDGAVLFLEDAAVMRQEDRAVMRHFPDQATGHVGVKPGSDLWPLLGELLATCPSGGSPKDVLVLVKRLSTGASRATRPASRPASGPAGGVAAELRAAVERLAPPSIWDLALLRYSGQEWNELAVLPAEWSGPGAASIAARGGDVYALLKAEQPVLLALSEGSWRTVSLPAGVDASGGRLVALAEGLVLFAFDPDTGAGSVNLLAGGKWSDGVSVRIGDDAAPWKGSPAPEIARFGNKLAFAWLEHGELFFGQCGLDGNLTREPLKIFERTAPKVSGQRVRTVFLWAVWGVLLALMVLPGQRPRTGPFSLPEGMLPAPIGRRGIAFLIDMLPFAILFLSFMVGDWEELFRAARARDLEGEAIGAFLLASFLAASGYAIYSLIMELFFDATLGKMAMRLRVVGTGGRKPTAREVALRNVSKIPEIIYLILLVPVVILLTRYHQRLGDKIAWTAVIDASYLPPPPATGRPEASPRRGGDDEQRPTQP